MLVVILWDQQQPRVPTTAWALEPSSRATGFLGEVAGLGSCRREHFLGTWPGPAVPCGQMLGSWCETGRVPRPFGDEQGSQCRFGGVSRERLQGEHQKWCRPTPDSREPPNRGLHSWRVLCFGGGQPVPLTLCSVPSSASWVCCVVQPWRGMGVPGTDWRSPTAKGPLGAELGAVAALVLCAVDHAFWQGDCTEDPCKLLGLWTF